MKRGIFICVGVVLVLITIYIVDTQFYSQKERRMEGTAESSSAHISNIPLTRLDGSKLKVDEFKGKKVLVLIESDCASCQRTALQLKEHSEAFEDCAVYFISDAPLSQLHQAASHYDSAGENTLIARSSTKDIQHVLGTVQVPSVFIFSEQGLLVASFIGETPIEEILESL